VVKDLVLIGSKYSPFVRRVRLLLASTPYEFRVLDLMGPEGQQAIRVHSPIRRIPILLTAQGTIYDSRVIDQWIEKNIYHRDSVVDPCRENYLTLIDEVTDAGVFLLQNQRFELNPSEDHRMLKNARERVNDILAYLEQQEERSELQGHSANWSTVAQWLYCLTDWLQFRNIVPAEQWTSFPSLLKKQKALKDHPWVQETDPRLI
jgi:glutathione S-transferase